MKKILRLFKIFLVTLFLFVFSCNSAFAAGTGTIKDGVLTLNKVVLDPVSVLLEDVCDVMPVSDMFGETSKIPLLLGSWSEYEGTTGWGSDYMYTTPYDTDTLGRKHILNKFLTEYKKGSDLLSFTVQNAMTVKHPNIETYVLVNTNNQDYKYYTGYNTVCAPFNINTKQMYVDIYTGKTYMFTPSSKTVRVPKFYTKIDYPYAVSTYMGPDGYYSSNDADYGTHRNPEPELFFTDWDGIKHGVFSWLDENYSNKVYATTDVLHKYPVILKSLWSYNSNLYRCLLCGEYNFSVRSGYWDSENGWESLTDPTGVITKFYVFPVFNVNSIKYVSYGYGANYSENSFYVMHSLVDNYNYWTARSNAIGGWGVDFDSKQVNYDKWSNSDLVYNGIELRNCTTVGTTLILPCTIKSGRYEGPKEKVLTGSRDSGGVEKYNYIVSPAINNLNNITIDKATLIDNFTNMDLSSKYLVGDESDSTIESTENKIVHTIKLSNPPVIIDWGTMPPIQIEIGDGSPIKVDWSGLDLDLSAPTIEVIRVNPTSPNTPASQVVIRANATDPDGNLPATPISYNGGAFVANGTNYTITENGQYEIMARDSKGNTRSYILNVNNIDTEPPIVTNITQSITAWTKNSVVVTVTAEDDVKLHATPYRYEFTPLGGTKTTSAWTADRTFTCSSNGVLRVGVRDTLYTNDSNTAHYSWSAPYYIRNIDKTAPTAIVTIGDGQKHTPQEGVTVTIDIADNADAWGETSGLSNSAYNWSTGNSTTSFTGYTNRQEKVFHTTGTYYVKVKDALGNESAAVSFTINANHIATADTFKPVINSITKSDNNPNVAPPIMVTVNAGNGANGPNPGTTIGLTYSYDGGVTWVTNNTHTFDTNGDFPILVKDSNGNITEGSVSISNIDTNKPTAKMYMAKGKPLNWDNHYTYNPNTDAVWQLRVVADDLGSGIGSVVIHWQNDRTITNPSTPYEEVFDVTEPGDYSVTIRDKSGNETTVSKTVTAEMIGATAWGIGGGTGGGGGISDPSNPGTPSVVGTPTIGPSIGTHPDGSAGKDIFPSGKDLQNLVFGPDKVIDTVTGESKAYPSNPKGIPVKFTFSPTSNNNYVSGYITFNGKIYPVTLAHDNAGPYSDVIKCPSSSRTYYGKGFIDITTVVGDINNGRVKVTLQEWADEGCTILAGESTATFYTSVQNSKPTVNYTYNKVTDLLTINASSTVAGIESIQYDDGTGWKDYTGPFPVNGATNIKVRVRDKVGNEKEITIDSASLSLTGSTGGSLPTEGINEYNAIGEGGNAVNSWHNSNRSADFYIVGGTRSNTGNVPKSSIYELAS